MDEPMFDALAERLDRLERECCQLKRANRRWRALGVAFVFGAVAALGLGAGGSNVIDAVCMNLRDDRGRIRASLSLDGNGSPRLRFHDRSQVRGSLGLDKNGVPDLKFHDHEGKVCFSVEGGQGGSAALRLGNDGASVFEVNVDGVRDVGMLASHVDGEAIQLEVNKLFSKLSLGKQFNEDRISLVSQATGDSNVMLYPGPVMANQSLTLEANVSGSVGLSLNDKDGKRLINIGGKADGTPFLRIQDKNGGDLLRIPIR